MHAVVTKPGQAEDYREPSRNSADKTLNGRKTVRTPPNLVCLAQIFQTLRSTTAECSSAGPPTTAETKAWRSSLRSV